MTPLLFPFFCFCWHDLSVKFVAVLFFFFSLFERDVIETEIVTTTNHFAADFYLWKD